MSVKARFRFAPGWTAPLAGQLPVRRGRGTGLGHPCFGLAIGERLPIASPDGHWEPEQAIQFLPETGKPTAPAGDREKGGKSRRLPGLRLPSRAISEQDFQRGTSRGSFGSVFGRGSRASMAAVCRLRDRALPAGAAPPGKRPPSALRGARLTLRAIDTRGELEGPGAAAAPRGPATYSSNGAQRRAAVRLAAKGPVLLSALHPSRQDPP